MNRARKIPKLRNLVIVFGDQLNFDSSALSGFNPQQDAVLITEVRHEATYIPQHKTRLVLFFSAMRHFRDELRAQGFQVYYRELDDPKNTHHFATELDHWAAELKPERLVAVEPGDYRVRLILSKAAKKLGIQLDLLPDASFFCSIDEFREHANPPRKLILETFYERMRRKHNILLTGSKPEGGSWNFDAENRKPLPRAKTFAIPLITGPQPDSITEEVKRMVEQQFPDSPGSLAGFDYPVTRSQALQALKDFIDYRLPLFGPYQDAMTTRSDYLFHSRLSSSMNLHLLSAREVVQAALEAYEHDRAPLTSVEGFIRQILGWREFVRGIYWQHMPDYAGLNELHATLPVPRYLWTANTDMHCVHSSVEGLKRHAYAHHIQRLMVLGLHSLLLGVHPYRFHEWHMSMFVDAIDWVSLPNALGMSQFGDGGIMGTKPYCASGKYIDRMSDYCKSCRYKPDQATGPDACPFTTLYWDFLVRHADQLNKNPRLKFQMLNMERRKKSELVQIRQQGDHLKQSLT